MSDTFKSFMISLNICYIRKWIRDISHSRIKSLNVASHRCIYGLHKRSTYKGNAIDFFSSVVIIQLSVFEPTSSRLPQVQVLQSTKAINMRVMVLAIRIYLYYLWPLLLPWINFNYNMTVWILARNDINFSMAAGLIRLHMPGVK